jgi:hypothetical protein
VALWAMLGTAEAKLVRYEINGQRYSYSTNNRQQVRAARQRIQAAQQAAAERAANPLVRLFGSPTQTNAPEAQARAQHVLAQPSQAVDVTSSVGSRRAERRRAQREAQAEARQTRLSRTPQLLDAETAGKAAPATTRPDASAERPTATDAKRAELASHAPHAAASAPSPVPEPAGSRAEQKPAIKSVSFDLHAGIKTVHMADGSVHEEPIDSSMASTHSAQPAGVGPRPDRHGPL